MAPEQDLQTKKLLIMVSGNGSNFEAIVKHFQGKGLADTVKIELMVDNKNAYAATRAKKLNIPCFQVNFDNLEAFFKNNKYDLHALAGYMRILPEKILKTCAPNSFINIHPSLLPKFKGKNAIQRAFDAGVKKTGVTVHFVSKKVDSGKIIEQKEVSAEGKSLEALTSAVHAVEHAIYPAIIENLLFKKNVLLFGSGAREHAIAQAISISPFLNSLFLAGTNDGFKHLGKSIDFTDYKDLAKKCVSKKIDLAVIGPENPLIDGITDIFEAHGIKVIGANKAWARLEGSKHFAKKFMEKNGIKTAFYKVVEDETGLTEALEHFKKLENSAPPVIKADGPALGKGVYLPKTFDEAKDTAKAFLNGKFGEASKKILLETRLFGREISVMSLWDGKTLTSFPPASDYKRLLDDDRGPNTGGMGSIAPSPITRSEGTQIKKYLNTLENALKKEGAKFTGIVYSGLILTQKGPYVLEYNMRFGDPEIQALLEILDDKKADLLNIFIKMSKGCLKNEDLHFKRKIAYCLTLASEGYPVNPKKGAPIKNIKKAEKYGCKIYYAGTKNALSNDKNSTSTAFEASKTLKPPSKELKELLTNGGRVLSIVKSGTNPKKILQDIYKTAETIDFEGKIYRKDVGQMRPEKS